MVGRAAISNPWALARIWAAVSCRKTPPEPTLDERVEVALEHLRLMIQHEADASSWGAALDSPTYPQAELWACRHLRGQIPMYIKGAHGAAQLRDKLTKCNAYAEVEDLLREFALASLI
jgi:tRNA-dihydrouridine synthase